MTLIWKAIGGAVLFILTLFAFNRWKDSQASAKEAAWKVEKQQADSIAAVRVEESYRAGLANAQSIPVYIQGKARIIRESSGTPAAPAVKACFDLADTRISACEASRKADSATIQAKNHQIALLESKPEKREKRLVLFGAAGYSITSDSAGVRTAPAFRLGMENKLIGPLKLVTDAQLTMPGRGHSNPMWQANILAKVSF